MVSDPYVTLHLLPQLSSTSSVKREVAATPQLEIPIFTKTESVFSRKFIHTSFLMCIFTFKIVQHLSGQI